MGGLKYIVQSGDTLAKISGKLLGSQMDYQRVASYNHLSNPDQIFPGQVLQIPDKNFRHMNSTNNGEDNSQYTVCYGDTLWSISATCLGASSRWGEIARINHLSNPDHLYVGQTLALPADAKRVRAPCETDRLANDLSDPPSEHRPAKMIPARSFFFVIADEFNPLRKKFVRKVIVPPELQENVELCKTILRPDKYGFLPKDPCSNIPVGRHVLGMTNSKYISCSEKFLGASRFKGKRFWIDAAKLAQAGINVHDSMDIIRDLERIASKCKDPGFLKYIDYIKNLSVNFDKEILVEGKIPAKFVKSLSGKIMTHGLQFVGGVGVILTVYDLEQSLEVSYNKSTLRPFAATSVRKVGGWGPALAGFKVGGCVGGALGFETGPGALLFSAVGSCIGGMAGYFGAEWIANYIYDEENEPPH